MVMTARRKPRRGTANIIKPRKGPPVEAEEDEDGLELPVNPDEGAPLIPDDDERVVNVPS